MKATNMRDTINEIRRCLTKPKLKTPEESKQCFCDYMCEKHGVTGLDDPKCKEILDLYRKYPAMDALFTYMELD
jgi:hypothetical protein